MKNSNFEKIKSKISVQNVATYYQIATFFNLTDIIKLALSYIERCFTIVCETKNFLELDFNMVAKILASSELRIDSELEVLDAAENWVKYNCEERRKFSKDLMLKVRLPLLPSHVVNSLLRKDLFFNKIDDCVKLITEVSHNNKIVYQNKSNTFLQTRLCTQNMFNVIVSGGVQYNNIQYNRNGVDKVSNSFQQIDCKNFNVVKSLASMKSMQAYHKAIYCKGEIYVFGGYDFFRQYIVPVEKYSLNTNTWEHVADIPENRKMHCACAFMGNIFVIGGHNDNFDVFNSCMKLDTIDNKWNDVASTKGARSLAACTVFEGRVVVLGGKHSYFPDVTLNTVEAYDQQTDTWSYMPNMIERRGGHSSVAYKNKLFVTGSYYGNGREPCEVFDSTCNHFVFLKKKPNSATFRFTNVLQTFSVGSKLITFGYQSATALCYDVEKEEWSEEPFVINKNTNGLFCTVVPKM